MRKIFAILLFSVFALQGSFAQADIHAAVATGDKSAVKLSLKLGAGVNDMNRLQQTPLYVAVSLKDFKIAKFLVKKGADLNTADFTGDTPLMMAVERDDAKMVKYLLKKGAKVDHKDNKGWTAIMLARSKTVAGMLVKAGANVTSRANDGSTALMVAAEEGRLDLVKYLVEQGANPKLADKAGFKPIDYARKNSHSEIVDFLKPLS
jgi:serine/threonine-protein phosphatase 6 regulatory ankyrin repeat subunit B